MSFRDYIPRHLWPFRVYVPSVRMSISLCEYILPCGCPIRVYIPPPPAPPCVYVPSFCIPNIFPPQMERMLLQQHLPRAAGHWHQFFASLQNARFRPEWIELRGKILVRAHLLSSWTKTSYCRELLNENGKCDLSPSRGLRGNTNKYCATYCADEIVKQKIWIERHPCRIYGH